MTEQVGDIVARDALAHSFHPVQNLQAVKFDQAIAPNVWVPLEWKTNGTINNGTAFTYNDVNEWGVTIPGVYRFDLSVNWGAPLGTFNGRRAVAMYKDGALGLRWSDYANPAPIAGAYTQNVDITTYIGAPGVFEMWVWSSDPVATSVLGSESILEGNLLDRAPYQ